MSTTPTNRRPAGEPPRPRPARQLPGAILGLALLLLVGGADAGVRDFPKCPDVCGESWHHECPGRVILHDGGHVVALNLSRGLNEHTTWDIRVALTDDPTGETDLARFKVKILDEINYALYASGKPYEACEEAEELGRGAACISFQVPVCKQRALRAEEGRGPGVANYTHVVIECAVDRLTCPLRYSASIVPVYPPPPCTVGSVSCGAFAALLIGFSGLAAGGVYAVLLLNRNLRRRGGQEMQATALGGLGAGLGGGGGGEEEPSSDYNKL